MATGGGIDRPKSRTRGSHRHRHAARWVCDITYSRDAVGNFISDRQRVLKSEPQVAQTAPNATTLGTPFVNWLQSNFGWLFAQAQANATLGQSYAYDDGQLGATSMLLGEYGNGGTNSAGRNEYLWLPNEDGTSTPIGLHTNSRLYAVHADPLNTPRQITDDANATVWQLTVLAFAVTLGLAEVYTLVADADLPIRRDSNQAHSLTNTIDTLTAGAKAIVVCCEDYKSDIALIVQTETGAVGYVNDGAFHLKREGLTKYLLSDPERLVWSCRGFFDTRKVD